MTTIDALFYSLKEGFNQSIIHETDHGSNNSNGATVLCFATQLTTWITTRGARFVASTNVRQPATRQSAPAMRQYGNKEK